MAQCASRASACRRRSSYRAARGRRRPISLSGNCPHWCRRRFSWPATVVLGTATEQQAKSAMSTGLDVILDQLSEFVAETDAERVDVGVDRRGETNVFPLRPQKQA